MHHFNGATIFPVLEIAVFRDSDHDVRRRPAAFVVFTLDVAAGKSLSIDDRKTSLVPIDKFNQQDGIDEGRTPFLIESKMTEAKESTSAIGHVFRTAAHLANRVNSATLAFEVRSHQNLSYQARAESHQSGNPK